MNPSRKKSLWLLFVLVLFTSLTFSSALRCGFTNWDDDIYILDNPAVKSLSAANLKTILTVPVVGNYHPLTVLSFALEYHFFKDNPLPYHATNVLLHTVNACLVFILIAGISKNLWLAFLTALFFSINPLRAESVAWATERKDVLYSAFFLSGLITYIHFIKREKRSFWYLTLFLFLGAVLSKPQAVIFPLILFAVDYFYQRKLSVSTLIEKAPFFLIAGVSLVLNSLGSLSLVTNVFYFSPLDKFFLVCHSFILYTVKSIVPFKLSCIYPYPPKTHGFFPLIVYISPLILVISAWLIKISKNKLIVFGGLFFVLTIALPSVNILTGGHFISDRLSYFPSIGIFLILSYLFLEKLRPINLTVQKALILGLSVYLVIMAQLTFNRCLVWKDSLTLWSDAISKYPGHYIPWTQRGETYRRLNQPDLAFADFKEALRLDPESSVVFNSRGSLFLQQKQYDLALADFNRALSIEPGYQLALNNRGIAKLSLNDIPGAISDFEQALQAERGNLNPYPVQNLSYLYLSTGQIEKALYFCGRSIELDPDYVPAYLRRADIYSRQKKWDFALRDYNSALRLDPSNLKANEGKQKITALMEK